MAAGWPKGWKVRKSRSSEPLDAVLADVAAGVHSLSVEQLWREQPYLRTVVTFLARNIAQLGIHAYRREDNDSRVRLRGSEHPVARLLAEPNPDQTLYELLAALVGDLALYDRAFLFVEDRRADGGPVQLRTIPHAWVVDTFDSTPWRVGGYAIEPESGEPFRASADDMIVFHGWNPSDLRTGVSPVHALKDVLYEQISASIYRRQLWDNGGRVGSYLTRPKDAPEWSNEGRARFKRGWTAAYTGNGKKVGGVPVLEDGMELKRVGFSAKDEDYVEASKLALTTVASVYHVNPTMLGLLDNANYSNVKEFRRGLYGDTLGPIIAMIEAKLNTNLLPRLDDTDGVYVEFNIREKLQGSFEEESASLATALNAGWMTPNEARQRQNLPAIDGGDELRAPLNMAVVQPEPNESEAVADAA